MKSLLLVVSAACIAPCIQAQPADPFYSVRFLTGEWVGEGAGSPGDSAGACSFTMDLQGKVMVRKSFSQSATGRHEDLMVIYLDQDSKSLKAIYFDNEGHVIHYSVEPGSSSVRFLNQQYRLTYRKMGADKLALDFDIAAPGKPFSNYLHATLRKKSQDDLNAGIGENGCSPASLARSTSPQLIR